MPRQRQPVRLAQHHTKAGELKTFMDELVHLHKTRLFRDTDPISLPWRYASSPQTCELVAYLTAMFSYGQRSKIIATVDGILTSMSPDPMAFVMHYHPRRDKKHFQNFVYRFNRGADLAFLCERLRWAYTEYGSLENLFLSIRQKNPKDDLKHWLALFTDTLVGHGPDEPAQPYGRRFMFAHPSRGGACKRLNMFLRWMVRQDDQADSAVDLGLWKQALTPAELLIPLDTHVSRISRQLGLTRRTTDDWRTAEEITSQLRAWCPEDPIRYDFALMGYGLEQNRLLARNAAVTNLTGI